MNHSLSIAAILRFGRSEQKDFGTIMMRICVNGKRAEISTQRKIDPARWDSKFGRVKGNKEDARELNNFIETMNVKINRIHREMIEDDEVVTVEKLKNKILGRKPERKTLLQVFRYHNEMMQSRVGIDFSTSTMIRYNTTFTHLENFLLHQYKKKDVYLDQIQFSFITDIEHYLKVERRCNHNSTLKYIRNFRKIINMALRNDWIDKDPFKAYRVKLKDTKRVFLTRDELRALEEKEIAIPRLEQVRDVFVFCCYTGLSYVDVEKLGSKDITKANDGSQWIVIDRTKTGHSSSIPLLPKALQLLVKYKNNQACIVRGKLLPVISNQRINGYLKEVASLCDVDKKLTFHAARHTFATTVTLSNGIPVETVSAMLGHKNFRTTQIYAKVVQEKIRKDMMGLEEKLG